jgi:hypothetical protein
MRYQNHRDWHSARALLIGTTVGLFMWGILGLAFWWSFWKS